MGRNRDLPLVLNQREAIKLLEEHGWRRERVGGKHNVLMSKPGERPITLPMHNRQDYSPGLTNRILKQAGLRGNEGAA